MHRCFDGWTDPATNHPGRQHRAQQELAFLGHCVNREFHALSARLLTCFGYTTAFQFLSGLNSVMAFVSSTAFRPLDLATFSYAVLPGRERVDFPEAPCFTRSVTRLVAAVHSLNLSQLTVPDGK